MFFDQDCLEYLHFVLLLWGVSIIVADGLKVNFHGLRAHSAWCREKKGIITVAENVVLRGS